MRYSRGAAPAGAQNRAVCQCRRLAHSACSKSRLGFGQVLRFEGPLFCTSGVLVRANDGAIDEMERPIEIAILVGLGLKVRKDAVPDAFLTPAVIARRDGTDWAIAFRQIGPGRASAQNPQDPVDNAAMVVIGSASPRFLRGQQRFEPRPLFVSQFISAHTHSAASTAPQFADTP